MVAHCMKNARGNILFLARKESPKSDRPLRKAPDLQPIGSKTVYSKHVAQINITNPWHVFYKMCDKRIPSLLVLPRRIILVIHSARITSFDESLAIEQGALIVECSGAVFSTLSLKTRRAAGGTLAPLKHVPAVAKRYLKLHELNVRVAS